jgi:predicted RNase H-like nuclease
MTVVGVDGCRRGWVVARRDQIVVVTHIGPLVADASTLTIGVDMPIGLPATWSRSADREARRLLGWPRSSSVFPTPPRVLLEETTYAAANARSWAQLGQGLPRQTFHLFERIRELDGLAGAGPGRTGRLVEIHPECSFRMMAGEPLPSKHTADGLRLRRDLLLPEFGPVVDLRPHRAAVDDVLDAYAVLWSAERFARGDHVTLGDGSVDALGLPMRIVS